MALIVLDAEHNSEGVTYSANTVINVDAGVVTWLVGVARARAIVAGPVAWSATSFAANNLVTYGNAYWVNNASAVSGDVPGVAAKWVQVSYLISSVSVDAVVSLSGGRLTVRIPDDGNTYSLSGAIVDGLPVPAFEPTPL